ncbi:hypothetical protein [Sulfoacidibacillus thermotolerans]|uniref:N-acetyltransferase domain-containing protein n=1 Tax=Sulfoacidibacillus thermotolerans TaxID=1765684 RepID=A0A2U3D808_SULT2|nr:hypothetical protein [Sulfoacidibacillus thermotolerans]PWI57413.1 hypothetical protein BM613_08800 [Sulfoacidibacillus thermotolerans]
MEQWAIREAVSRSDLEQCKRLATAVWGQDSSCSTAQMSVHARYGGVVLLALDGDEAIGFTLSFPALWHGEWVLWSHETAVLDHALHRGIGFALKQYQRRLAVQRGYKVIMWTFDPLVSRNAHFNLNKLGAKVVDFLPNCYGMMEGDPLNAGVESDRFVARLELLPEESLGQVGAITYANGNVSSEVVRLRCTERGDAEAIPLLDSPSRVITEIPGNLKKISTSSLRAQWVQAMRAAVMELQARGFVVVSYSYEGSRDVGKYIWERVR